MNDTTRRESNGWLAAIWVTILLIGLVLIGYFLWWRPAQAERTGPEINIEQREEQPPSGGTETPTTEPAPPADGGDGGGETTP